MLIKNFNTYFASELLGKYSKAQIRTFFFILIEELLNLKKINYALTLDYSINRHQYKILCNALNKLKKEEPIQYILGKTEFCGLTFKVDKNVLIPRPETEELVKWIIVEAKNLQFKNNKKLSILDVGTGSGCVAISLSKLLLNVEIYAIDISKEALKIAKNNAKINNVKINFIRKDILKTNNLNDKFDIIVSNPPYIRKLEKPEINNNVLSYEPHLALFVENNDPLIFYKKIAELSENHLTKTGFLFLEINQYLSNETLEMLSKKKFKNIELKKDLFGNDRMIKLQVK